MRVCARNLDSNWRSQEIPHARSLWRRLIHPCSFVRVLSHTHTHTQRSFRYPTTLRLLRGMSSNPRIQALLAKHSDLSVNEFGKIHCATTKHDLVANSDVVEKHLSSDLYRKSKEWYAADFSKHEPWIVAHKRDPHRLWCNLTGHALNRIPAEVRSRMVHSVRNCTRHSLL